MAAGPRALADVFTVERIQSLAGVRVFARAALIATDDIQERSERDGVLRATVRGTMPYSVALWVQGTRKAAYSCTCPQGADMKFCKHAAALALTMHGDVGPLGRRRNASGRSATLEDDPVFEFLLGLEHRELVQLVYEAAKRDSHTARRVETLLAASLGRSPVDVKQWRKEITAAFGRPSRFVDYYEAPRWADRVGGVLDGLRELLDDGHAAEVVQLAEYAFERADKATQHVDSSDGWFGPVSSTIAELHLRACEQARPDPAALATRLAHLDVDAELDTFRRAAHTYREVLGTEGLDMYRSLIEPQFAALGPRTQHDWSVNRFHLTEAMLGLALAHRDADAVIRIKEGDLRAPTDYLEIIDALVLVDRHRDAIGWAQRGLSECARHFHVTALRTRLVELLRSAGDHSAALQARLEGFHERPSLHTYRDLLADTDEAQRAHQRAEALEWLRDHARSREGASGSVLVEILLYEGELDDAWAAASSFGCDERWWMTLARAREATHPDQSIPIYQRAVEALINKKDAKSYKAAVDLMARIEPLYAACDDSSAWFTYLDCIIEEHRRKTNLMARIADRGWS